MNKYAYIVVLLFFCASIRSQKKNNELKDNTEYGKFSSPVFLDKYDVYLLSTGFLYSDEENECRSTETNYLTQGVAPIVLYNSDIYQLKIKEIEMKDSVRIDGEYLPFTFNIHFDKMGLFNGFSLYPIIDNRIESLSCFMQSSCLPTIGNGEYLYWDCFSEDKNEFIVNKDYSHNELLLIDSSYNNIQLNFYISSSLDRCDYYLQFLSKIKILPFFGANGYMYIDSLGSRKYVLNSNVINYNIIGIDKRKRYPFATSKEEYYKYGILKKTQSDRINMELYQVADRCLLTPITGRWRINKNSSNFEYYYYGDNPYFSYVSDRNCEDEEEGGVVVTHNYYSYYADTIYNRNRWLGILADEDYVLSYGDRGPHDSEFEKKVINETFSNQHVIKVSKKDFLINGQNGCDYLLNFYNNRNILVKEEYEDENSNHIPAQYKFQKEIVQLKELPDKIVVQLTLTDFWYIQLTE